MVKDLKKYKQLIQKGNNQYNTYYNYSRFEIHINIHIQSQKYF